jgi:hypothetical protein
MTRTKQLWASIFLVAMFAGGQPALAQTSVPQAARTCGIDDVSCLKARALDRIEAIVMADVDLSAGQARPGEPA